MREFTFHYLKTNSTLNTFDKFILSEVEGLGVKPNK